MQYIGSHRLPRPVYLRLPVLTAAAGVAVTAITGVVATIVIGNAPDRDVQAATAARPSTSTSIGAEFVVQESTGATTETPLTTGGPNTLIPRAGADRAGGRAPVATASPPADRRPPPPARPSSSTTTRTPPRTPPTPPPPTTTRTVPGTTTTKAPSPTTSDPAPPTDPPTTTQTPSVDPSTEPSE